jgi:hypothetical protein
MAGLGDLVVNLVADASRMTAGLREGISQLEKFSAATVAMATASVYRFIAVGDSFNDMAARTGIAVEALSGLSYAAKLSDTSAEGLQSALFKMAKFLDGVRSGSAEASGTLREFGISTSQILAASPEQQFGMFADAVASIQDPSLRAVAAMKVFGKGAAEIIPLLMEGSTGINRMMTEAGALGAVMSTETAAAAAETADAVDRLTVAFDAAAVQVGSILAPAIKTLANALAFIAGANQDNIRTFASLAIAIAAVAAVMKTITVVTQAYAKAQAVAMALTGPKGWITLGLAAAAAAGAVALLNAEFGEQNRQLEELQKNGPAAAAAVAGARPQRQVRMDLDVKAERVAAMQAEAIGQQMATADAQVQKFRESIVRLTYDYDDLYKNTRETFDKQTLEQYKQTLIGTASGYTDAVQKLQTELEVLRGETTAQEQEFARMMQFGVSNAQIDVLRAMQAEREKILQQQAEEANNERAMADAMEQRRRNEEAAQEALKSEAEAIVDSLKTPLQKAQEQVTRIQQLQKQGLLTQQQADAAIAKIAESETQNAAQTQRPEMQFASAMQRGSSAAFNTILSAMGRGAVDPNVKATEKQTQQLIEALKANKTTLTVAEGVA